MNFYHYITTGVFLDYYTVLDTEKSNSLEEQSEPNSVALKMEVEQSSGTLKQNLCNIADD
jgi:hypothetical protein